MLRKTLSLGVPKHVPSAFLQSCFSQHPGAPPATPIGSQQQAPLRRDAATMESREQREEGMETLVSDIQAVDLESVEAEPDPWLELDREVSGGGDFDGGGQALVHTPKMLELEGDNLDTSAKPTRSLAAAQVIRDFRENPQVVMEATASDSKLEGSTSLSGGKAMRFPEFNAALAEFLQLHYHKRTKRANPSTQEAPASIQARVQQATKELIEAEKHLAPQQLARSLALLNQKGKAETEELGVDIISAWLETNPKWLVGKHPMRGAEVLVIQILQSLTVVNNPRALKLCRTFLFDHVLRCPHWSDGNSQKSKPNPEASKTDPLAPIAPFLGVAIVLAAFNSMRQQLRRGAGILDDPDDEADGDDPEAAGRRSREAGSTVRDFSAKEYQLVRDTVSYLVGDSPCASQALMSLAHQDYASRNAVPPPHALWFELFEKSIEFDRQPLMVGLRNECQAGEAQRSGSITSDSSSKTTTTGVSRRGPGSNLGRQFEDLLFGKKGSKAQSASSVARAFSSPFAAMWLVHTCTPTQTATPLTAERSRYILHYLKAFCGRVLSSETGIGEMTSTRGPHSARVFLQSFYALGMNGYTPMLECLHTDLLPNYAPGDPIRHFLSNVGVLCIVKSGATEYRAGPESVCSIHDPQSGHLLWTHFGSSTRKSRVREHKIFLTMLNNAAPGTSEPPEKVFFPIDDYPNCVVPKRVTTDAWWKYFVDVELYTNPMAVSDLFRFFIRSVNTTFHATDQKASLAKSGLLDEARSRVRSGALLHRRLGLGNDEQFSAHYEGVDTGLTSALDPTITAYDAVEKAVMLIALLIYHHDLIHTKRGGSAGNTRVKLKAAAQSSVPETLIQYLEWTKPGSPHRIALRNRRILPLTVQEGAVIMFADCGRMDLVSAFTLPHNHSAALPPHRAAVQAVARLLHLRGINKVDSCTSTGQWQCSATEAKVAVALETTLQRNSQIVSSCPHVKTFLNGPIPTFNAVAQDPTTSRKAGGYHYAFPPLLHGPTLKSTPGGVMDAATKRNNNVINSERGDPSINDIRTEPLPTSIWSGAGNGSQGGAAELRSSPFVESEGQRVERVRQRSDVLSSLEPEVVMLLRRTQQWR